MERKKRVWTMSWLLQLLTRTQRDLRGMSTGAYSGLAAVHLIVKTITCEIPSTLSRMQVMPLAQWLPGNNHCIQEDLWRFQPLLIRYCTAKFHFHLWELWEHVLFVEALCAVYLWLPAPFSSSWPRYYDNSLQAVLPWTGEAQWSHVC